VAVVQKIIVQHGGQVQARNRPEGGLRYCYVTAAAKGSGSSRIKEGQHLILKHEAAMNTMQVTREW